MCRDLDNYICFTASFLLLSLNLLAKKHPVETVYSPLIKLDIAQMRIHRLAFGHQPMRRQNH